MPLFDQIQRWIKEPPPEYIFEVSERGLAYLQPHNPSSLKVRKLEDKALAASPSQANFLRPDLVRASLPAGAKAKGQQKGTKAAIVIPDYATRISVLDFEELPGDAEQQEALIRFRLRKSVPFSIDEARISSAVQSNEPHNKRVEVLAAAISHSVLDEYEAILSGNGFQVGLVVPSSIAALSLCSISPSGFTLFAKLSGAVFSIILLRAGMVRVVRCVDLSREDGGAGDETSVVSTLLHQTFAFVEDEYGERVERLVLCGFGELTQQLAAMFQSEFHVSWEQLTSRFGVASQENAGLLGLAEQYAA